MSQLETLTQVPPSSPDKVIRVVNQLAQGKINPVGTVTLRNGQTTTTLLNNAINPACVILFSAQTADAAAVAASLWYDLTSIPFSNVGSQGQITLHHSNTANTDQTFGYVVFT